MIKSAEFIVSNTKIEHCPTDLIPEYAFIGRSNVGKSSLINMICDRKNIAKISKVPGKTKVINHYRINDSWFLVDLPGYGYAKLSKNSIKKINSTIENYFLKRKQLLAAFLLIDIRHECLNIDINFMKWLNQNLIPFDIIFTKADKLKSHEIEDYKNSYINCLLKFWSKTPKIFVTSSKKNFGKNEIINYIEKLNSKFTN